MAIECYYRTGLMPFPELFVQGLVYLPRLQVSHDVDFLIDTGADNTCLHYRDMVKLAVDYRKLRRNTLTSSSGVGGSLEYCREDAMLVFLDMGGEYRYWQFEAHLSGRTDSPANRELPSLLGRDFINLCHLQADRSRNRLLLDPLNVVNGIVSPPALDS